MLKLEVGALSLGLFLSACTSVGEEYFAADKSQSELQLMIREVSHVYSHFDANGDGVMTQSEYVAHLQPPQKETQNEDLYKAEGATFVAFYKKLDLDDNGIVTLEEYAIDFLANVRRDFALLDADQSSEISFVEFIHPRPEARGAAIGSVNGTSFRFGASIEEVDAPFPFLDQAPFDSNYTAYMGHAFARWDKDESFTLSFDEFAGIAN